MKGLLSDRGLVMNGLISCFRKQNQVPNICAVSFILFGMLSHQGRNKIFEATQRKLCHHPFEFCVVPTSRDSLPREGFIALLAFIWGLLLGCVFPLLWGFLCRCKEFFFSMQFSSFRVSVREKIWYELTLQLQLPI